MASSEHFKVAIVGGGLCGLALAIALKERAVPFTVYESRASFMESGAGINLGPNTLQAFRLIEPSLGDAVTHLFRKLTGDPLPKASKDLWMTVRLAGPTNVFEDGYKVVEIAAPPTGNATARRNDLLQLLADMAGVENARFGKKLVDIIQDDRGATLKFSDSTEATADVVIACDGIHSAVRRWMVGEHSVAARPQYSQAGVYRAVLPVETLTAALGKEIAETSTLWLGSESYMIQYPVDFGQNVNIGLWPRRTGTWDEREWVLPSQKNEMEADFASTGELMHKIMALMPDPPFFAAFHHAMQPASIVQGRVCLIGDAAHSMGPHMGAGSGQAMEDAYVIANAIAAVSPHHVDGKHVAAALKAYDAVRTPHSQRVLDSSMEAFDFWTNFYRKDLTAEDVANFAEKAQGMFPWVWYSDLEGQGRRATALVEEYLANAKS